MGARIRSTTVGQVEEIASTEQLAIKLGFVCRSLEAKVGRRSVASVLLDRRGVPQLNLVG